MEKLTHLDEGGQARMVDVSAKPATERRARARVTIAMQPATAAAIGDVLGTARLAGIQAAKRTADLIPLAHPLPISQAAVEIAVDADAGRVTIEAEATVAASTGVEMEAMTACAVAALTLYDMVKGLERGVTIERLYLLEKTGGKRDWHREPAD